MSFCHHISHHQPHQPISPTIQPPRLLLGRWFHLAGLCEQKGLGGREHSEDQSHYYSPWKGGQKGEWKTEIQVWSHPCFPDPGNFCLGCQPYVSHGQTLPVLTTSVTQALNASHPEPSPVGSAGPWGQSPENITLSSGLNPLSQVWTGRWDFLSGLSTPGGSSCTVSASPQTSGHGPNGSNTDGLWSTSTPGESLTRLLRQGRATTQYLPVPCPVFSTDCLIQSWVLSIWNNFRSSSSRAMSPQKTAGRIRKQKHK